MRGISTSRTSQGGLTALFKGHPSGDSGRVMKGWLDSFLQTPSGEVSFLRNLNADEILSSLFPYSSRTDSWM